MSARVGQGTRHSRVTSRLFSAGDCGSRPLRIPGCHDGVQTAGRDRTGPVSEPPNCAFGADGTLYITSATAGLSDAELADQPHAGSVFGLATDTPRRAHQSVRRLIMPVPLALAEPRSGLQARRRSHLGGTAVSWRRRTSMTWTAKASSLVSSPCRAA
jgi:hypothetical protein